MATGSLTHADADLILKLYDLRREPLMRDSRNMINGRFLPRSAAEVIEMMSAMDHPMNQAFRQVSSYWEMVYGFAKHGIVNPDFLIENNGEGLFLYAKLAPYMSEIRSQMSPTAFENSQWIAENCNEGKRRFEMIKGRIAKMLGSK